MFDGFFEEEELEDYGYDEGTTSTSLIMPVLPRPVHGLAGISNQGATCYLNSLLQTIYMTPELRATFFSMDLPNIVDENGNVFEEKDQSCSDTNEISGSRRLKIPSNIQLFFSELHELNVSYVSTERLTNSFGWNSNTAVIQQDVQELNRILFDVIDRSLKETSFKDFVDSTYSGELITQCKCLTCNYASPRKERFLDICLPVNGRPTLYNALDNYTAKETLDGNNQYFCSTCDKKVDAVRETGFQSLPDVLMIGLNRFEFDWNTETRTKITTDTSFPLVLDMNKYMIDYENKEGESCRESNIPLDLLGEKDLNALQSMKELYFGYNESSDHLYELFSVVIHDGSAHAGHYYSAICDLKNDTQEWYMFNDTRVEPMVPEKLVSYFGGRASGYMLVYRKRGKPVNFGEVPVHLQERLNTENIKLRQDREEIERLQNVIDVEILTEKEVTVCSSKNDNVIHVKLNETLEKTSAELDKRLCLSEQMKHLFPEYETCVFQNISQTHPILRLGSVLQRSSELKRDQTYFMWNGKTVNDRAYIVNQHLITIELNFVFRLEDEEEIEQVSYELNVNSDLHFEELMQIVHDKTGLCTEKALVFACYSSDDLLKLSLENFDSVIVEDLKIFVEKDTEEISEQQSLCHQKLRQDLNLWNISVLLENITILKNGQESVDNFEYEFCLSKTTTLSDFKSQLENKIDKGLSSLQITKVDSSILDEPILLDNSEREIEDTPITHTSIITLKNYDTVGRLVLQCNIRKSDQSIEKCSISVQEEATLKDLITLSLEHISFSGDEEEKSTFDISKADMWGQPGKSCRNTKLTLASQSIRNGDIFWIEDKQGQKKGEMVVSMLQFSSENAKKSLLSPAIIESRNSAIEALLPLTVTNSNTLLELKMAILEELTKRSKSSVMIQDIRIWGKRQLFREDAKTLKQLKINGSRDYVYDIASSQTIRTPEDCLTLFLYQVQSENSKSFVFKGEHHFLKQDMKLNQFLNKLTKEISETYEESPGIIARYNPFNGDWTHLQHPSVAIPEDVEDVSRKPYALKDGDIIVFNAVENSVDFTERPIKKPKVRHATQKRETEQQIFIEL